MQYKTLGDTGLLVSTICLGCMTFHGGSGFWSTIGNVDQAGADGLVKGSIEAGVNFFDTADVYSEGESEKTLGQSLNSAGGVKELYYSNAGMIDMDKKRVTPDGG
jgi:aryl-alcohol dehydrogenase-like predicted oxidoreductase